MCTELNANLKRKKRKKRLWYHCKPMKKLNVSQLWVKLLTKYTILTAEPVLTQCILFFSLTPCELCQNNPGY